MQRTPVPREERVFHRFVQSTFGGRIPSNPLCLSHRMSALAHCRVRLCRAQPQAIRVILLGTSFRRFPPVAVVGILIASAMRETVVAAGASVRLEKQGAIRVNNMETGTKLRRYRDETTLSFSSCILGSRLKWPTSSACFTTPARQALPWQQFCRMTATADRDKFEGAAGSAAAQSSGGVEETWVQRKVSIRLALDPVGQPTEGISHMLESSVKEIEQYRIGMAHLQVQAPGLALTVGDLEAAEKFEGTSTMSSTISIPIAEGKLSTGGEHSDVLVRVLSHAEGSARNVTGAALAFEILVTLQGDRQIRGALPATHVVGQPRDGDDESPLRAAALDEALRATGGSPEDILSESFQGSAARRAYMTFVNPRPNRVSNKKETLEEAAKRTAIQVSFLEREHRAMLAEFLRNADAARSRMDDLGMEPHRLILVLDNVRSVYNVGSIFRTAETARVQEIVTCGITPHPPHEKLRKTALSAVECVKSRHFDDIMEAIATLKEEGVRVMGMETTTRSKGYTRVSYPEPSALILGNELTGISTQAMEACDDLIEIPTFGLKNSLNVASACPVVVFEVLRQWDKL